MSNYEDMMRQAQEMAQRMGMGAQLGTPMDMNETAAYQARVMKLNQSGNETPATITSVQATGKTDFGGGKEILFGVDVAPPNAQPYAATFSQFMVDSTMGGVAPGARITVGVDPDDPTSMMFWGSAG